jgi:pimeloyl-ACP methyl ester carboxylesterase
VASITAADGTRLYAEVHGDGIPMLFSCALCTTHVNWRPQVEPLTAAGVRVILWDYRGHGESESPSEPAAYSMDRVVDDMGRVLDWAAPGAPAVLAGLSFGGLASLHFSRRHPERVRGLVLVASGPGFKNPEAQARWERNTERSAAFIEKHGLASFVEKAADTAVGRRPSLPAAKAAAAAIAAQDPQGLTLFARRIAAIAEPVIDDLPNIEAPALVVVGEADEAFLRAAEVMVAKLPNAERVIIPGAGHIVNIEAADAFDTAVLEFLRGRGGAVLKH